MVDQQLEVEFNSTVMWMDKNHVVRIHFAAFHLVILQPNGGATLAPESDAGKQSAGWIGRRIRGEPEHTRQPEDESIFAPSARGWRR